LECRENLTPFSDATQAAVACFVGHFKVQSNFNAYLLNFMPLLQPGFTGENFPGQLVSTQERGHQREKSLSWATALELPKSIMSVRSQRDGTTNFGRWSQRHDESTPN